MAASTSAAAYRAALENGLVDDLHGQIYNRALKAIPGSTANEVWRWLTENGETRLSQHSCSPRFRELVRLGLICETEKRACRITGVNCVTWVRLDTPGVVPVVRERPIVAKLETLFAAWIDRDGLISTGDAQAATETMLSLAKELGIKL